MDSKVTVITLFEENAPKMAGVLNTELRDYICDSVGIEPDQLEDHLSDLEDQGVLLVSEATLH